MIELWSHAQILPASDGTWQPSPDQEREDDGIYATLHQIEEPDGSLLDVVAWEFMGEGSPWWLLRNRAIFLGAWAVEDANRRGFPCWLVRTPKQYMRMAPAACILDWSASHRLLYNFLTSANKGWVITDEPLKRRVEKILQAGPVPLHVA